MAGLTRRAVVLTKVQTGQGVDSVPSPFLNALAVRDLSFTANGQVIERNNLRDSLSRIPHRMGRVLYEANFTFDLMAGPALGARPEWSTLMRAGGFQETVTGTVTSIRTAALKWTISGTGTATYYVDLSGGGDPALADPKVVRQLGEDMTRGSIATLKPGQFAYGNQDTLGFNTIYVRLTDDTDPDSKALAYVEAVTAGTNIVYNLRDTGHEFATVYIYPDGLLVKMVDSIVDWSLTFNAGQIPTVTARVQSKYATPTDVAIPTVVNYQSQLPPIAESMLFTMDGFATSVIPAVSIQSGTQIGQREDINSPLGLKSTFYAGRSVNGSMTIEQELAATFPLFSKFDTSDEVIITTSVGTTPQKVTMSLPNVQFGNIASTDIGGQRGFTVPLFMNENLATSAKEFKITLE